MAPPPMGSPLSAPPIGERETALADAQAAASSADATGLSFIAVGVVLLLLVKFGAAALGNFALESQFARWRSDRTVSSGWSMQRMAVGAVLFVAVVVFTSVKFAQPDLIPALSTFPTDKGWRLFVGDGVQAGFDWLKTAGRGFFDGLTASMRTMLDWREVVLVQTPWPVVALVIVMLAYLSAGPRVAIFTGAALA